MDDILEMQRGERADLGEQLMTALRDQMPFGMEVDLGLGRKARFVGINGNPAPDVKDNGQGWGFMCDFQLQNCDQDHIEVTVRITGGGGFV